MLFKKYAVSSVLYAGKSSNSLLESGTLIQEISENLCGVLRASFQIVLNLGGRLQGLGRESSTKILGRHGAVGLDFVHQGKKSVALVSRVTFLAKRRLLLFSEIRSEQCVASFQVSPVQQCERISRRNENFGNLHTRPVSEL